MPYLPKPPSDALMERLSKIWIPTMRDPAEELAKALALTNLPTFAEGREQVENAAKNKTPRTKKQRALAKSMAEELAEMQAADAAAEVQKQAEWNQRYDASIRDDEGNLKPSTPGTRWQARQDEAAAAQAVIRASVAQGAKKYDNKLLGLQGPTTQPKPMFMPPVIAEGVKDDAEKLHDQLAAKGITIPVLSKKEQQRRLRSRADATANTLVLTDEQRNAMRQVQLSSFALNIGPTDRRYPLITGKLAESYQESQARFAAEREKDTGFVSPEGRDTTKQYRSRLGTRESIGRGHTPLPVLNTAQYTTRVNPPADPYEKRDPEFGTPRGSRAKVIPTEFAPERTLTDHEYARWNHPEGQTHAVRTAAEEQARPTKAMEYSQYNVAPQFGVTLREAGVSPEHANYEETPFIQFYRAMQAKSAEAGRPSLWSNQSNPSNPTMVLQYGRKRVSIEQNLSPRDQSYVTQAASRKAWEQDLRDKNNAQRDARKAVIDADKAAREASGIRNIPRHRSLPVNPNMSAEQYQNNQGMYQRLQTMEEASAREPIVAALGENALNDAYQAGGFPPSVLEELNRLVVHQKLYKGGQEALTDEEISERIQGMVADMGPVTVPTADSVGKTRTQALSAEEQGKMAVEAFRMSMSAPATQAEQTTEAFHQNIVLNTGMPASIVKELFKDVSVEQLAAIQSHANRLMINAGAGGGKSLTAFARVAYLFAKGQVQNDGLYLSGTKSGAAAMVPQIQRLQDAFGERFVDPKSQTFKAPSTTYSVARGILFNSDQKVNGKTAWETLELDRKRYSRALVSSGTGKDALSARDVQKGQFLSQEELVKKMMQSQGQAPLSKAKLNRMVARINEIKQDPEAFKAAMTRGAELHAKYRRGDVSLPMHERTHASDFVQYGRKDTLPDELQVYRYQKTLHAKEGFVLHDTQFATPHHDILDMLYQAETAAKAGFGPRPSHIVLDEMQDSHRQEYRMVAALAGPDTHIITAGDLSQMAIPTNRRPDQYAREELAAGGHEVAEHTLLLNQRTRSPILLSIANALLQSHGLNVPGAYAHGDPQLAASAIMGRSKKNDPTIHSAGSYEEMFRQAIGHSFTDIGKGVLPQMRKNLTNGEKLWQGIQIGMLPRESPTIMQTRSERTLYRKVFKQFLGEHLGEEHAQHAFEQLYTEDLPANASPVKFAGLLVNEAKSNSLESPKIIMQRTGKWNKAGYLLNLYTMLTRARGRARLYSSNKGLPGQTHLTGLQDFHGVQLPPELHEVMEIAAHDLVHRQNYPVDQLPDYLASALANPHVASPSMLNSQPALLHHLIEATTMAGTNYQPAMASTPAVREDGVENAYQEKDDDQEKQDKMKAKHLNAASLANEYDKDQSRQIAHAREQVRIAHELFGTLQPAGKVPRTTLLPGEELQKPSDTQWLPRPDTFPKTDEAMVQTKLVYDEKNKRYDTRIGGVRQVELVPDSVANPLDIPDASQAVKWVKEVITPIIDMPAKQRELVKAQKIDTPTYAGTDSDAEANFPDRDWLKPMASTDDRLAVEQMQATKKLLLNAGHSAEVKALYAHGQRMHDGSGSDGTDDMPATYGVVNPTFAGDLANLAEAKGFQQQASLIRALTDRAPFRNGEQGMAVSLEQMQELERTNPRSAATLRRYMTTNQGVLQHRDLNHPETRGNSEDPAHMAAVEVKASSTEMADRYGITFAQSALSPLATELQAFKQSLLTTGYVDPMAGQSEAAHRELPEITPGMAASLRELSISNPDAFTAYKDQLLDEVHETYPASYTPEGIGVTGDAMSRIQRDLANVPIVPDAFAQRRAAGIPETEDRENFTAFSSLNDLQQKFATAEALTRTKASLDYLGGLSEKHRDYNPKRIQELQALQARQEQELEMVTKRNQTARISPGGVRQLQRAIDQKKADINRGLGGESQQAIYREELATLHSQMQEAQGNLPRNTTDFGASAPAQQAHLDAIHAILNNDQKMGTEYPRMLNYFMQATSGHNMVESTIKPGTNNLDAEHKVVVDHARQLLAGVTSEYRGNNRDVAGVHEMLSTLDEVSTHYAEHGTMDRSHIRSLINVLGLSRREEDHPMLSMLTRKFDAKDHDDYTVEPEMIMTGDATSVPFRSAIAPILHKGDGFMYMGGRGGFQTIKPGEEGQLVGTLEPFTYRHKGETHTVPFGRPITNGQRVGAGLNSQQEYHNLLNPYANAVHGIDPDTGRKVKSKFRQVYEEHGGRHTNVDSDLNSEAGRAADKWRKEWFNTYTEPAYNLRISDKRSEPVSLSQISPISSREARILAVSRPKAQRLNLKKFQRTVVEPAKRLRTQNAVRQLPNRFPTFESPPAPLYQPKSLREEGNGWHLKQMKLRSNEMQGYEPMQAMLSGQMSMALVPMWDEGNTKGYKAGDEIHMFVNKQATGMVMRVTGNQLINESKKTAKGDRLLSDLSDEQIKRLGYMGSTPEEIRREIEAQRVFGKGFQAVSLEPVFIPEHLKALHQGRTMAADWAAMAAYNPDLALTEQERYAKSHAARVDIHAGDGRPSVYTLGYQQEGAWGHMMDAVKEGAVIVDVRKDVTGNIKKGWDQASLKKQLGEQYVHIPELGNVNHGQGKPIQLDRAKEGIAKLKQHFSGKKVVLMCACGNPETCHRTTVANMLKGEIPGLEVHHLGTTKEKAGSSSEALPPKPETGETGRQGTFSYSTGNILESGAQTLVNTVNMEGHMGKGLALAMKNLYPEIEKPYRDDIKSGKLKLGQPALIPGNHLHPSILNFATKNKWKNNSQLEWIEQGMAHLATHAKEMGIRSIAFPKLGTNNGKLDWNDVGPIMAKHVPALLAQGIDVQFHVGEHDQQFMPPAVAQSREDRVLHAYSTAQNVLHRQFSAFNMQLGGKSIENWYQFSKRDEKGNPLGSFKESKGKQAHHFDFMGEEIPGDQRHQFYLALWHQALREQPALFNYAKGFDGFSDIYAEREKGRIRRPSEAYLSNPHSSANQAAAIAYLVGKNNRVEFSPEIRAAIHSYRVQSNDDFDPHPFPEKEMEFDHQGNVVPDRGYDLLRRQEIGWKERDLLGNTLPGSLGSDVPWTRRYPEKPAAEAPITPDWEHGLWSYSNEGEQGRESSKDAGPSTPVAMSQEERLALAYGTSAMGQTAGSFSPVLAPDADHVKGTKELAENNPFLDYPRDHFLEEQRKQLGGLPATPALDIEDVFKQREYDKQAKRAAKEGHEVYPWDDPYHSIDTPPWDTTPISRFSSEPLKIPGRTSYDMPAAPPVVSSGETTTGKKTTKTRAGLEPYTRDDYHIIPKDDPRYPTAMLSQMGEEAPILHARGDLSLLGDTHRVAVSASYKPSEEEKAAAYAQGQALAQEGHITVANMGKAGILAHKGAIEAGGRSIAVLPKGLHPNEIMPKADRAWIEEQVAQKKMLLTGPVPMGHRLDGALSMEPTWTAEGMIKALGTMPAAPPTVELPPAPAPFSEETRNALFAATPTSQFQKETEALAQIVPGLEDAGRNHFLDQQRNLPQLPPPEYKPWHDRAERRDAIQDKWDDRRYNPGGQLDRDIATPVPIKKRQLKNPKKKKQLEASTGEATSSEEAKRSEERVAPRRTYNQSGRSWVGERYLQRSIKENPDFITSISGKDLLHQTAAHFLALNPYHDRTREHWHQWVQEAQTHFEEISQKFPDLSPEQRTDFDKVLTFHRNFANGVAQGDDFDPATYDPHTKKIVQQMARDRRRSFGTVFGGRGGMVGEDLDSDGAHFFGEEITKPVGEAATKPVTPTTTPSSTSTPAKPVAPAPSAEAKTKVAANPTTPVAKVGNAQAKSKQKVSDDEEPDWLRDQLGDDEYDEKALAALQARNKTSTPVLTDEEKEHPDETQQALQDTHGPTDHIKAQLEEMQHAIRHGKTLFAGTDKEYVIPPASQEQLSAIDDPARHMVVKAGPGSGKTMTMIKRMLGQVSRGMLPQNMLSISALRSGRDEIASQMGTWAQPLLPNEQAYTFRKPMTIHALAHHIVMAPQVNGDEDGEEHFSRPVLDALGYGGYSTNILQNPSDKQLARWRKKGAHEKIKDALANSKDAFLHEALSTAFANHPHITIPRQSNLHDQREYIEEVKKYRVIADEESRNPKDHSRYGIGITKGRQDIAAGFFSKDAALAAYEDHRTRSKRLDFDDQPYLATKVFHQNLGHLIPADLKEVEGINTDESQDLTPSGLYMISSLAHWVKKQRGDGKAPALNFAHDPSQSAMAGRGGIPINELHQTIVGAASRLGPVAQKELTENYRSPKAVVALVNSIVRKLHGMGEETSPVQKAMSKDWGKLELPRMRKNQATLYQDVTHDMLKDAGIDLKAVKLNADANMPYLDGITPALPLGQMAFVAHKNDQHELFEHVFRETVSKTLGREHGERFTEQFLRRDYPERGDEDEKLAKDQITMATPANIRSHGKMNVYSDITGGGQWPLSDFYRQWLISLSRPTKQLKMYAATVPFDRKNINRYKKYPGGFTDTRPDHPDPDMGLFKYRGDDVISAIRKDSPHPKGVVKVGPGPNDYNSPQMSDMMAEAGAELRSMGAPQGVYTGISPLPNVPIVSDSATTGSYVQGTSLVPERSNRPTSSDWQNSPSLQRAQQHALDAGQESPRAQYQGGGSAPQHAAPLGDAYEEPTKPVVPFVAPPLPADFSPYAAVPAKRDYDVRATLRQSRGLFSRMAQAGKSAIQGAKNWFAQGNQYGMNLPDPPAVSLAPPPEAVKSPPPVAKPGSIKAMLLARREAPSDLPKVFEMEDQTVHTLPPKPTVLSLGKATDYQSLQKNFFSEFKEILPHLQNTRVVPAHSLQSKLDQIPHLSKKEQQDYLEWTNAAVRGFAQIDPQKMPQVLEDKLLDLKLTRDAYVKRPGPLALTTLVADNTNYHAQKAFYDHFYGNTVKPPTVVRDNTPKPVVMPVIPATPKFPEPPVMPSIPATPKLPEPLFGEDARAMNKRHFLSLLDDSSIAHADQPNYLGVRAAGAFLAMNPHTDRTEANWKDWMAASQQHHQDLLQEPDLAEADRQRLQPFLQSHAKLGQDADYDPNHSSAAHNQAFTIDKSLTFSGSHLWFAQPPLIHRTDDKALKTPFSLPMPGSLHESPISGYAKSYTGKDIHAAHQEMIRVWEELPEAYHEYVQQIEHEGNLSHPHKRGEALSPSEYLAASSKKIMRDMKENEHLTPHERVLPSLMSKLFSHAAQQPAVHKELRKAVADLQGNHYPRGVMQHFMNTKNPGMTTDQMDDLHADLQAKWENLPKAFQEQLHSRNITAAKPISEPGNYLVKQDVRKKTSGAQGPSQEPFEEQMMHHFYETAQRNAPLHHAMKNYAGAENEESRLIAAATSYAPQMNSENAKYTRIAQGNLAFPDGQQRALYHLSALRKDAPDRLNEALASGKPSDDPGYFHAIKHYRNLNTMEAGLGVKLTAIPQELHPHARALVKADHFNFNGFDQDLERLVPPDQSEVNQSLAGAPKDFLKQLAAVNAGGPPPTLTAQNVTVNTNQPVSVTSKTSQVNSSAASSSSSPTGSRNMAPPPPAAMQPPPPPGGSAPSTSGKADDEGKATKKKSGKSSIWSNEETAFGHTMTRIGGELQFLGQLGIQIADAALKQGSDYRQATMTLGKSTGATGDSGFFDINGGKGTIDAYEHKVLPALSMTQVAQLIQSYTGSTNTTFNPATTLGNTTDIGALSTITGMDTAAIQAPMVGIAGTLGQGGSSTAMAPMAGMLYQMYGGNLSATNVAPTLQTVQEILPQLQGLNPAGGSQLPQAMALLQTGLNAGMTTENFGQISSVVNTLASAGSNPDTQQQYQLANLFGQKNLTADTGLVGYQSDVLNRQENLAQTMLQQNINGKGLTLPNLQIQISQAQITMDKAQLDMSGLQQQYNVASFQEQQKIQDAETGPIGADVSRTSYFDWMRNQQQAGYNPLSPETGTQFKKTPTFGLQNEQFYAGIEHQRSMMVLGRSPLLADAAFQENMKYLNLQEAFYKEQLKLTNDQRSFTVTWQTKLLAAQGHVLDLQEKQFGLSQEMADYQQQQDKIANDYLGQQVDALQKIIVADQQSMNGDGPLNGKNIQPADIVNMLAQKQKTDPTATDEVMRKQISQLVNGDPAQTNTLFQLMKQLEKPGANIKDIEKQLAGTTDKALLAQLQKEIKGGAFQSQQQTASQANQSLQYGGTGDDWKNLIAASNKLNDQMEGVAKALAKTAPLTLYLGNISQHIGDLATGIGTIANIIGFGASIVSALGGARFIGWIRTFMPAAAGDAGAAGGAGGAAGVAGGAGGGLLAALALPVTLAVLGALGIKMGGDWMQQHIDYEQAHPAQSLQDSKSLIDKLFGWLPPEWRPKPSQSAQDAVKKDQWLIDHPGQKYPGDQKTNGGPHVNPSLVSQPVSETPASHLQIQQQHPTVDSSSFFTSQGKWMQDHLWGPVGKYIQDNWKIVTGDFRRYGGIINDNWKIVTGDFQRYGKWIQTHWAAFWEPIGHWFNTTLPQKWDAFWGPIGDWFHTLLTTTIPNWWGGIGDFFHTLLTKTIPDLWSGLIKGISDGWNTQIVKPFSDGFQSILHFFGINTDKNSSSSGQKNPTSGSNNNLLSILMNLLNGGNPGGSSGSTGGGEAATVPAGHPGFITPPVNAEFHKQMNYGQHQGVDFAAAQGTSLRSFNAGQVTAAGWYPWGGEVDVNMGNGLTERYLHLSSLGVHRGQQLGKGDYVGLTGGGTVLSGLGYWSSGAHSHVQIDQGNINKGINPWDIWALTNTTNISQYYGATKGAQPNPVKSHPRNYSADGGVALSPTTTTVGEGGQPEAIVPLSQLSTLAASIMGWLPPSSQGAPLAGVSSTRGKSTSITIGTINLTVGDGHGKMSAAEKDSLFNDLIGVLDAAATHVSQRQE